MIQLAYVSNASDLMSSAKLASLLRQARSANERAGITGMLLYKDVSFLQVLEGPAEVVHDTYAEIMRDPRHHKVKMLYDRVIVDRDFPDWQMGFRNLDGTDLGEVLGYSEFMEAPDVVRGFFENLTTAKKLLLLFRSQS